MKIFASPFRRSALAVAGAILGALTLTATPLLAAGDTPAIPSQKWSFSGPFGLYDRGQLQRGYKVYKEVCAACHGLRLLHYRNLGESGGPEFNEAQVKTLAAEVEVQDGPNEDGDMFDRPGKPSDAFVSPFPNKEAARAANNGAYPPDLSLMAKARVGGPDYIYALMTGYKPEPDSMDMQEGMSYNEYFPGHQIAMAAPLSADSVEYTDGTPPTVDNYARDVSAFLMWAAEPKLEERHRLGFRFMIYLVILAGLLYMAKRRVWSRLKH
ncbi:MAG: cytochrome c1 [Hyphomicrobiaceae bacterium]|nr:cytochrome c1 [Hyphomicrobiaceae bacterium]